VRVPNHDFDDTILDDTAHRPWPLPDRPWIMTQTWHDLLFAHWRVAKDHLASLVPAGLELDLYNGEAWIGIVPFHMTNVAPRGVPSLPWVSEFPELNVRTYVRVGDKPGVYFFSLDAANPLAVAAARALFGLPYHLATMQVDRAARSIHYRSRRSAISAQRADFTATYEPDGGVFRADNGSLEYFLTERYCLYLVAEDGRPRRVDIHHPPWPLQPAEARIEVNTMAEAAGIRLSGIAPLLHYAKRQDVVVWATRPVTDAY
jgi:uncharacterized protein YqjF (DUF2071 family)